MCSETLAYPPPLHLNARHRKLSFPASFHSNLLGSKTFADVSIHNNNGHNSHNLNVNRRRFSNVSDVVSRKLSTTIGWRHAIVPTQEIVRHGKMLCSQYIRSRLKRSRLFTKKCGLQRLRSAASLPEGIIIREVFPELLSIGLELERMHPKLYTDVAKQANGKCAGGIIITDKTVQNILLSVSRSLFHKNISWAKIVSLYAIAGGLAADCVRHSHIEFIPNIIEIIGEIIEDELAVWINDNGGWIALQMYCKPKPPQVQITRVYYCLVCILLSVLLLVFLLKWFGKLAFIGVTN